MNLKFHQTVGTPNGPGLVQGVLRRPDQPEKIIVSHSKAVAAAAGLISGRINGIWHLVYYSPEDLAEVK